MHPTITIAKRAALSAGKLILRYYERLDGVKVSEKRRNDFVSEVDIQSEREIIRDIRRTFPDHAIVAEESGPSGDQTADCRWLIDPLDGTTNFLHGFPHFAISIAFEYRNRIESAIVYDPLRQEMFVASRGRGALLNDRRIRTTSRSSLDGTLLCTGFPARYPEHRDSYLQMFAALMAQCGEIRRTGSAALDLAYVANGRFDGFWEIGLHPWDIAAGSLLIQEAGGLVGDFGGGHDFLKSGNIVAGSAKVFKGILQTIRPSLPAVLLQ